MLKRGYGQLATAGASVAFLDRYVKRKASRAAAGQSAPQTNAPPMAWGMDGKRATL